MNVSLMRRSGPGPGWSVGTPWVFSGSLRSALEQGHRLAPWCEHPRRVAPGEPTDTPPVDVDGGGGC
jgi:hypothetical protein